MKLITEPTVYLLGRQQVVQEELGRFLADHGFSWQSDSNVPAEVIAETNGRLCYLSYSKPRPGGNKAYLNHLKEVRHGSVLEHSVFNLIVVGVSRSLTHELVRHRTVSPSQLSQRYVDESVAEYVVPPDLQQEVAAAQSFPVWCHRYVTNNPEASWEVAEAQYFKVHPEQTRDMVDAGEDWLGAVDVAHAHYCKLSNYLAAKWKRNFGAAEGPGSALNTPARKYARQAARSVLPNATETKIGLTLNARAARNVLEQRCSKDADPEIRVLAGKIFDVLAEESPGLFGDYQKLPLPDGTFELDTAWEKV